jgi:hypothetical protein
MLNFNKSSIAFYRFFAARVLSAAPKLRIFFAAGVRSVLLECPPLSAARSGALSVGASTRPLFVGHALSSSDAFMIKI